LHKRDKKRQAHQHHGQQKLGVRSYSPATCDGYLFVRKHVREQSNAERKRSDHITDSSIEKISGVMINVNKEWQLPDR